MDRAYSLLDIKAFDDEKGEITGIATTPTTDRMGDIVDPKGAVFRLPIPLLWQHDSHSPIGQVTKAKVTSAGIEITAQIARGVTAAIDEAWKLIRSGLVRGLSIGFRGLDTEQIPNSWGVRFEKWEWLELSAVTIPANAEATIQTVKSIDTALRAASGTEAKQDDSRARRSSSPPGVSGTKQPASGGFFFALSKGSKVNYQEQIKALELKRKELADERAEIQSKAVAAGRGKDAEERERFDEIGAELKSLDAELADMRELEADNAAAAVAVNGKTEKSAAASRGPTILIPKNDPDEKFKGQMYTRGVIAKALAYLSQGTLSPGQIAEMRWGKSHPQLVSVIKAGVAGGSTYTGTGDWGAELVAVDSRYTGDFIEYLDARTVFNQLPLRSVPANILIRGQDGGATGFWTGESKAIKVTSMDFMDVELKPRKVGSIAVVSNELLRDSTPSAEMLVRDSLVEALAQIIDTTFLGAAGASASTPAGILNSVGADSSAGNDGDAVREDIATLYADFLTAKNASGLHFVMNPSLAKKLQLMRNALGQREFEGITQNGGTLEGDPVVTGDNVNAAYMILLKPSDIYRIGDGGVEVSLSREATIEQDSAPTGESDGPVAASANLVSMFQTESTAFKVVRSMNFQKRRASAVAYINDADYGNSGT